MPSTLDIWLGLARNGLNLARPSGAPRAQVQAPAPGSASSAPGATTSSSVVSGATASVSAARGLGGFERAKSTDEDEDDQLAVTHQLLSSQSLQFQNEAKRNPGEPRWLGSTTVPSRPAYSFMPNGTPAIQARTETKLNTPSQPRLKQPHIEQHSQSSKRGISDAPAQNMDVDTDMNAPAAAEDELDSLPPPQIISDLYTIYPSQGTEQRVGQQDAALPPPPPAKTSTPSWKSSSSSSSSKNETTPALRLVVNIPTTPKAPNLPPITPGRSRMQVSIPPLSADRHRETMTSSSPVVAMGRRTNTVDNGNMRIRGGRPKGWKPGMSYREVALRNLGIDGDAASAVLLTPPRRPKAKTKSKELDQRTPRRRRIAGSQKPNYVLKRKGRPPLLSIEALQRSIFLKGNAIFRPFLCEWAGCRAELQNMATLRKHVAVVHGRAAECRWRSCADRERALPRISRATNGADDGETARTHDGGGKGEGKGEGEGQTLMEHIEYHHLAPVEWHQGDGFANSGCLGPPALGIRLAPLPLMPEEDARAAGDGGGSAHLAPAHLPRYLLDEEGNQVTPLVQDPWLEPAALSRSRAETMRRLQDAYRQIQRRRVL